MESMWKDFLFGHGGIVEDEACEEEGSQWVGMCKETIFAMAFFFFFLSSLSFLAATSSTLNLHQIFPTNMNWNSRTNSNSLDYLWSGILLQLK